MAPAAAKVLRFVSKPRPQAPVERRELDFANIYELCNFVRAEINGSKMKHTALAAKCDLCSATVDRLATGETRAPRAETVMKILTALGWKLLAIRA